MDPGYCGFPSAFLLTIWYCCRRLKFLYPRKGGTSWQLPRSRSRRRPRRVVRSPRRRRRASNACSSRIATDAVASQNRPEPRTQSCAGARVFFGAPAEYGLDGSAEGEQHADVVLDAVVGGVLLAAVLLGVGQMEVAGAA